MRSVLVASLLPLVACGLDQGSNPVGHQIESIVCGGSPAPGLLDRGLCVCEDFADVGSLEIGPGRPGSSAVFGVNGRSRVVNHTRVEGSWIAYGGLDATALAEVNEDLATAADLSFVGEMSVGRDLSVGGNLDGVGTLSVGGALAVAGENRVIGDRGATRLAPFAGPVASPCGCNPATFLDVVERVKDARTANENATRGIGTTKLSSIGATSLKLTSGSYYFEDAESVGQLTLEIEGAVAVHLDGDLRFVGDGNFVLAPGATLDLFIAGDVQSVGRLVAEGADPSAVRLFIGGESPVVMSVGQKRFRGAIYAPTASLQYVGDVEIDGAVLTRKLAGVGDLRINQWTPVDNIPEDCLDPNDGLPPDQGGGSPTPTDTGAPMPSDSNPGGGSGGSGGSGGDGSDGSGDGSEVPDL